MTTPIRGHHQITVDADPLTVWLAMRDYGNLAWAEGIEEVVVEGNGVGMLRKVRLDGTRDWILERLVARDDEAMSFSYAIEGDGMPGFSDYSAQVRAEPAGENCIIHWECCAKTDDDTVEAMQPMIQGLAEGICSMFAAQFERGVETQ